MKNSANAATVARTQEPGQQPGKNEKSDVSEQGYDELLPKLMTYFHDDRDELARALGLQRSTVERWFNGKSRPNNSTVLRMRRLALERLTST
jgi:transcriptional regulator with XRE-family HTH domain